MKSIKGISTPEIISAEEEQYGRRKPPEECDCGSEEGACPRCLKLFSNSRGEPVYYAKILETEGARGTQGRKFNLLLPKGHPLNPEDECEDFLLTLSPANLGLWMKIETFGGEEIRKSFLPEDYSELGYRNITNVISPYTKMETGEMKWSLLFSCRSAMPFYFDFFSFYKLEETSAGFQLYYQEGLILSANVSPDGHYLARLKDEDKCFLTRADGSVELEVSIKDESLSKRHCFFLPDGRAADCHGNIFSPDLKEKIAEAEDWKFYKGRMTLFSRGALLVFLSGESFTFEFYPYRFETLE